jgi:hypothetical protein
MVVTELICRECGNPYPLVIPIEWNHAPDLAIGPCCSRYMLGRYVALCDIARAQEWTRG